RFEKTCIICITGADFSPTLNNVALPLHQPVMIPGHSLLQFKGLKTGARCYLAILNETEIDPWLNSYSTNLKAAAGGWKGRRFQKEDEVLYSSLPLPEISSTATLLPWKYNAIHSSTDTIECIPGNEWSWLTEESKTAFSNRFTISASSDRMGFRLQGPQLTSSHSEQLLSSGVCFGTVQLLPNGQLIVLMADHQTTGGYPRIAHVVSVDLPKLAQLNAGQSFRFVFTSLETAQEKLVAQQEYLKQLQKTCNLKMQNWLHAH
ncbi:MAG TPA: biotin-dependent carboxyltransferase family protein, partial [Flavisolibacter sp.]